MTRPGFTLWFTGLSGSGKSTLAGAVGRELATRGYQVEILDGDEIRQTLSHELSFSKADRDLHIKRIGYMAHLLSRNGIVTVVAAISPYRDARRAVRRAHGSAFIEVYLECSLEALVRRDPKGLYAKALDGRIEHFTGVSDPYEAPETPEIRVCTDRESVEESYRRIVRALEERGTIARP